MTPRSRAARLLLPALLLARPLGAQPAAPALATLEELQATLAARPPGMDDAAARQVREACVEAFSTLAMAEGGRDGVPWSKLGSDQALALANLLVHRHRRIGEARTIAAAVESLLARSKDPGAALAAGALRRKLELLESRTGAGGLVSADLDEAPAPPPFLWPFVYAVAGLGGLAVLYLTVIRRSDDHGIQVADARIQAEAERALRTGLELLRQGRVEQSVKYFDKVATLESTLRARGRFFIALARLQANDLAGMEATLSGLDFAAIDKDEAYALGDVLEQRALAGPARQVFERLYVTDVGFRDVKSRLDRLRREVDQFTGGEVADMVAQRVLDPRYRELRLLGTGGMGLVYEARDALRDGLRVAVKVLSPFHANREEATTRFVREATGIAGLEHPNLVRIYDVFPGHLPYYSMEFLADRDLKRLLLERHHLPPAEAVALTEGICAGLGFAHRHGVTHRDMKPGNVLVLEHGGVKVIDFGIAHFDSETQMTVTGQVMGTPLYMSPEQVKGMELDHRSDIYSVGIMLFEMLTGFPPFETMLERGLGPAPALPTQPDLPPALAAVVARALERQPEDRYQELDALAQAARAALG